MSVSITLDTSKLDTILRRMDGRADEQINEAGQDLRDMVKAEVKAMGVYDSGDLYNSVEWKATPGQGGVTGGVVVVGAKSERGFPYPIAQHEGWTDRGGGWHAGRPFMRVAVEKFKRYFRENYFGRLFD